MIRTAKKSPIAASVSKALRERSAKMAKPAGGTSKMYSLVFGKTKGSGRKTVEINIGTSGKLKSVSLAKG